MQEKNAVILSAAIHTENGCLDISLELDYGNSRQVFGGYVLYLPESYAHHSLKSPAGHFIYRLMEVAGVKTWENLPGKAVRVKADYDKIYAIGHIIKNDWFIPSEAFAKED